MLQTWFNSAGIAFWQPSVHLVKYLIIILAALLFIAMQTIYYSSSKWDSLTILSRGAIVITIFCLLSQLIFSSVMRLNYEMLISIVALMSLVLNKAFLQPNALSSVNQDYLKEIWDLLKFVTPICIGIPILMGGVGFISSFYQGEQSVIRLQLYRHVSMAIYIELGAILFIIYPLFRRILIIKNV